MEFDWDEAKRARTLEERGVDFAEAAHADWKRAAQRIDARKDYGEARFVVLVPLRDRLHVIAYTVRNGTRRIISMRKANPREEARYVDPTENAPDGRGR